jgi:hypothetical protein
MNEERQPLGVPQEASKPEESPTETLHEKVSANLGLKIGAIVLALVAGLGVAYGWLQRRTTQELAASREELSAALAQARNQADALAAKVDTLSAAQAREEAARAAAEAAKNEQARAIASGTPRHSAQRAIPRRKPVDDPRWQQIRQQLGDQQKKLAESQQQIVETQANLQQAKSELEGNLQNVRAELGTGIARNHEELVALEKKGERNYYEFDLGKSKDFHHAGPISISLRKANTKHGYCDLEMLVNDSQLSKKHVDLYESVQFYPEGYGQPLELVINRIGKDFMHGYVSEPKHRASQQVAGRAVSPTTASVNNPPPTTPDPTLKHRPEGAR